MDTTNNQQHTVILKRSNAISPSSYGGHDWPSLVSVQKLPRVATSHAVSSGGPCAASPAAALWVEVEYFDEQRLHLPGVECDQHLKE